MKQQGEKEKGKEEGRRKGGKKHTKQRVAKASFYLLCFATRCKILSRSSALNPARKYKSRS